MNGEPVPVPVPAPHPDPYGAAAEDAWMELLDTAVRLKLLPSTVFVAQGEEIDPAFKDAAIAALKRLEHETD